VTFSDVGSTPTASTIFQQLAVSHWQLAFVVSKNSCAVLHAASVSVSQTIPTSSAPSVPPCFKRFGFQSSLLAISEVSAIRLILVLVLFWHIIFRELPCPNFALVGITRVLNAADGFSFHVLAFFHQLFHALRIVIASA